MRFSSCFAVAFMMLAHVPQSSAELDLVDLVSDKLISGTGPGAFGGSPNDGTYELTLKATRHLLVKHSDGGAGKDLLIHVFPGTLIVGSDLSQPVVVSKHMHFIMPSDKLETKLKLNVFKLGLKGVNPFGPVSILRMPAPGCYVVSGAFRVSQTKQVSPFHFKDDPFVTKTTTQVQLTPKIRQFALIRLQGKSRKSYDAAFTAPKDQLSSGEEQAAEALVKAVSAINKEHGLEHNRLYQAASQRVPAAMVHLAELHLTGISGFWKSRAAAASWYRKAALVGDAHAQHQLAVIYAGAAPPGRDLKKMKKWLEMAANAGRPAAMTDMGLVYQKGWGTTVNNLMAKSWYTKAINIGDKRAEREMVSLQKQIAAEKEMKALAKANPPKRVTPSKTTSQTPRRSTGRVASSSSRRSTQTKRYEPEPFWKPGQKTQASSRSSRMMSAALLIGAFSQLGRGSGGSGGSSGEVYYDGAGHRHISRESADQANMQRAMLHGQR